MSGCVYDRRVGTTILRTPPFFMPRTASSSPGPVPDDYGARRQIERELAKMDPENFFVLEVEAVNVR